LPEGEQQRPVGQKVSGIIGHFPNLVEFQDIDKEISRVIDAGNGQTDVMSALGNGHDDNFLN
jgi:hypothetical protein